MIKSHISQLFTFTHIPISDALTHYMAKFISSTAFVQHQKNPLPSPPCPLLSDDSV